ncbi:hypothetical protein SLS62_004805 [Diatrype stigma]|uniref:Xylanolytic transcriptional activator regulatory domain-containing protein n=1 Tax=Diatrype stigma TaxID=117547 RepID=A0AAN9UTT8_9PEZI
MLFSLNAYYLWIHGYFPILPAPEYEPTADQSVALLESESNKLEEPSSAISLAISAILALIPCPEDTSPLDPESVAWRRKYAQFLAKSAVESIETEQERPESSVEPSKALDDDSEDEMLRERFHPDVPLELESIIALDLLSVYEYAQRGNLKKMRTRANAALMTAMSQGLHKGSEVEDGSSETRRRVWWMTYTCVSQASIVSNTAWPAFIQAQQAILAATQFVIKLNQARKAQSDMRPIFKRMQELESFLEPSVIKSEDSSLGFQTPNSLRFPFTRHHSSKVCLKSALSIAEAFDALPYPNPTGKLTSSPCCIGYASPLITPRTMPAFACCAMQSAYVLLMIKDQTQALYPPSRGDAGPLVDDMLNRLKQGLWSVWGAFVNYGAAFEALGGMRGESRALGMIV